MRSTPSNVALLVVLVVCVATLGTVGAGATTNPKRIGTGGMITCFNDQTLQYSGSVVGPPLKSFTVENPCDTWMRLYFARQAGIVQVFSVPPDTSVVNVSIDALRAVGLANLQYDSAGSVGSVDDMSACSANLAGIPADVVEPDAHCSRSPAESSTAARGCPRSGGISAAARSEDVKGPSSNRDCMLTPRRSTSTCNERYLWATLSAPTASPGRATGPLSWNSSASTTGGSGPSVPAS